MNGTNHTNGYGRGELRRFPAYRTKEIHDSAIQPLPASSPPAVVSPEITAGPAVRRSPVGRLIVSLALLTLLGYGGYEIWHTFWRYEAFGTVTGRSIGVFGPWDGLIRFVHVKEGEAVRQGQLLITLENAELLRALERIQDDLRVAQANLEAETSRLQWQSSQQRDIYQESVAEYYQGWGTLTADEAKLSEMQIQHQRLVGLYNQGMITSAELERSAFQVKGLENKVAKTRNAVVELKKRVDGSRGLVESGEAQLKPFLARLDSLHAEHERLRTRIAEGLVTAPTNGVVVRRHRFAGEFAPQSESILTLLEEGSQEIVLYLRQPLSDSLAAGNTIQVLVDPSPDPIPCRVTRIGQEFVPPPESIKRNFREGEWLLPVYLQPEQGYGGIRIGASVKLPRQATEMSSSAPTT